MFWLWLRTTCGRTRTSRSLPKDRALRSPMLSATTPKSPTKTASYQTSESICRCDAIASTDISWAAYSSTRFNGVIRMISRGFVLANLTTGAWVQLFNIYDPTRILDNALINVTVNCSCWDASLSKEYGLFVTYPLWPDESLNLIAAGMNLTADLIRSYNPGVNFSAGSGLGYIPGKGEFLF